MYSLFRRGRRRLNYLKEHTKGNLISCATVNPIGQAINADYFLFEDQSTAWIELSQASGLALLETKDRKPCITSTFGTGIQIKHAIEQGCSKIILGIGGSATNDAGAGIFQALGGRLLDKTGKDLEKGGAALAALEKIIPKGLNNIQWEIACDVSNPLLGPEGTSSIYAPQKGATPDEVIILDASLAHFAKCVKKQFNRNIDKVPGGAQLGEQQRGCCLFNAQLTPGFNLMAQLLDLENKYKKPHLSLLQRGKSMHNPYREKYPWGWRD